MNDVRPTAGAREGSSKMTNLRLSGACALALGLIGISIIALTSQPRTAAARQNIRDAFFLVYPDAVGTTIETVPSHPNHCGVCHFQFGGGGTRNPYGLRLEAVLGNFPNTEQGRIDAVVSIENEDPDNDGYLTLTEVTDTLNFTNTPTFPGLNTANLASTSEVDTAEIQNHLVPSTGPDTTPPAAPSGLAALPGTTAIALNWDNNTETDLAGYNVYRALQTGGPYDPLNAELVPSSEYTDDTVDQNVSYFYVVTALDLSGNESAPSPEAEAGIASNTFMHIENIVPSVLDEGGGQKYGIADVTIVDANGAPVAGAQVTGTFAGDFNGTRSAFTDATGLATLVIGPKNGRTNFDFCVDDVVHDILIYDADANQETCDFYP